MARRYNRETRQYEEVPDRPTDGLPDAKAASQFGYHSFSRGIDGKIESAEDPETGRRIAFDDGQAPEASGAPRRYLEANPTSAAARALNKPTGARAALDRASGFGPTPDTANTNRGGSSSSPIVDGFKTAPAPSVLASFSDTNPFKQSLPLTLQTTAPTAPSPFAEGSTFFQDKAAAAAQARDNGGASAASKGETAGRPTAADYNALPSGYVGKVGGAYNRTGPEGPRVGTTALANGGFVTGGFSLPSGPADGGTGIAENGAAVTKGTNGLFAGFQGKPLTGTVAQAATARSAPTYTPPGSPAAPVVRVAATPPQAQTPASAVASTVPATSRLTSLSKPSVADLRMADEGRINDLNASAASLTSMQTDFANAMAGRPTPPALGTPSLYQPGADPVRDEQVNKGMQDLQDTYGMIPDSLKTNAPRVADGYDPSKTASVAKAMANPAQPSGLLRSNVPADPAAGVITGATIDPLANLGPSRTPTAASTNLASAPGYSPEAGTYGATPALGADPTKGSNALYKPPGAAGTDSITSGFSKPATTAVNTMAGGTSFDSTNPFVKPLTSFSLGAAGSVTAGFGTAKTDAPATSLNNPTSPTTPATGVTAPTAAAAQAGTDPKTAKAPGGGGNDDDDGSAQVRADFQSGLAQGDAQAAQANQASQDSYQRKKLFSGFA